MLNAKSTQTENELYALAALFTYANDKPVTKQDIMAVLKELGVQGQSKLADLFECDVIKMKGMLSSISSAGPAQSTDAKTDKKGEEKPAEIEEEVVEEVELDFGDLF
jgi:ribosomal protein L12E/L44/L45/RPP1/RPP2